MNENTISRSVFTLIIICHIKPAQLPYRKMKKISEYVKQIKNGWINIRKWNELILYRAKKGKLRHNFPVKMETHHLIYFSMNFLWNSDRIASLIKLGVFLRSSIPRAQFLNTTSSSHRRLTLKSDCDELGFSNGFPCRMFS